MSKTHSPDAADPLLAALRQLPSLTSGEGARPRRDARAAYLRSFEAGGWHASGFSKVSRLAVPLCLAGIVGLYMTWAIAAATALVH